MGGDQYRWGLHMFAIVNEHKQVFFNKQGEPYYTTFYSVYTHETNDFDQILQNDDFTSSDLYDVERYIKKNKLQVVNYIHDKISWDDLYRVELAKWQEEQA